MNYKEILYFVATCLTISLEDKNKQVIEKQLQSDTIDWSAVVKVSTSHYVLPAMYFNFKRADFLKYLPADLVEYMIHISNLNKDRNVQIIQQAKELNSLLLENNIRTLFLKGTGNLLEGLYEDIGERMVGDIDLIVSNEDSLKSNKVLINNGYKTKINESYLFPNFRHSPRLIKSTRIAAVEIHKELFIEKFPHEFNYELINKKVQKINNVNVLSFEHQLALSIIANQINDNGFYFKTMALRNAYDVFLLSKKTNAKDAVNTLDKLSHPLNCFLAACYEVFNKVESIEYNKNVKTALYLRNFNSQFTNPILKTYPNKPNNIIKRILYVFYKFITIKGYRVWLFSLLTDKDWQQEKLVCLGIKNMKITK